MNPEGPVACSLSAGDLAERTSKWRQVAGFARSRHVENGVIVATYPRHEGLRQQLQELIAAEAECCPFMHFNLEERGDELLVELQVPDDMRTTAAAMLAFDVPPQQ